MSTSEFRTGKRYRQSTSKVRKVGAYGVIGLMVLAASVTTVSALAAGSSQGGEDQPRLPPGAPDVREMDVPKGKVPVASHEGTIAGFVDEAAEASPEGYPLLDLGTGRPLRGLEVADVEGEIVGYLVEGYGFLDLETSRDPGAVDQLLAPPDPEDMSPEQREDYEEWRQLQIEAGLDPGDGVGNHPADK